MMDRRTLLKQAAGWGGALWVAQSMHARPAVASDQTSTLKVTPTQRITLEVLQDRLLPSGPASPGARDLNATTYLLWAASDGSVKDSERRDLLRGLDRLDLHARKTAGKALPQLDDAGKDGVLRTFQRTKGGEAFMALVLVYTLEALLGDPVYGVNPNGVGWAWLHHNPGFPRPTLPWRSRT